MSPIHYIFYLLVFLMNPFLGSLILWVLFLLDTKNKSYYFLAFIMSAMLSLLNLTKALENDLLHHSSEYLIAGRLDYLAYLAFKGKEPVFYSFNYLCYYLSNGSVKLWIFVISFISYFVYLSAVVKILKTVKATKSQILLGIISAVFFPQLFSLSAHLVRQFVTGSIFLYFVSDYIFCKQNKWWLAIGGFFIHSSSIILFPLVFFKKLGDFKNYLKLNTFLLMGVLSYQLVAAILLILIGAGGFVGSVLMRGSKDTTFDLGEFNMMNYILMFFMWFASIKIYKRMKDHKKEHRRFFAIMFVLSLFILVNIQQSELSTRMFFYLFFFFPVILSMMLSKNIKGYKELNLLLSIFFIFFFIYRLGNGTWTYASLEELMKFNVLGYIDYKTITIIQ